LILRRTFPELKRTLIPRSLERFGEAKYYNASEHVWKWPDGRRVEFGYLDSEKDVYNYQGAELDGFFPDELTQFPRDWYLYIFSRIRTTRVGQRCRVVATSNPGGEYEHWVIERWAPWLDRNHPKPAKSGEIRYFRQLPGETFREVETTADDPEGFSRTFIRAGLKDNPYLGDDYRQRLNLLPEPWRSQLRDGDWTAASRDHERQVIPTAWVELAMKRWEARTKFDDTGRPVPPAELLTAIGLDVARGGKDKTVYAPVYRNWFAPLITFPGSETPDGMAIATQVATFDELGHHIADGTIIKPDIVGVGSSPADILKQNGFNVVPMNGGEGSDAADRSGHLGFMNKRAEWYWKLREALDPMSGDDIALPPDPELKADLTAPRWEERSGRIKVEAKPDIKARIGRSPDKGDAVVYGHAQNFASGYDVVNFYADMLKKAQVNE
jgi:hypothetical protein